MTRDYRETIRALRAKAADPVTTIPERKALNDKADELEDAHPVIQESRFTDYTTILDNLAAQQWKWNDKYYDRFGNPRSQSPADTDDMYEDAYRYQPEDEDEGYEEYQ